MLFFRSFLPGYIPKWRGHISNVVSQKTAQNTSRIVEKWALTPTISRLRYALIGHAVATVGFPNAPPERAPIASRSLGRGGRGAGAQLIGSRSFVYFEAV
ncbi:Hypothetical protein NTJ_10116 [Nesidiocoris tenuis]|uniref:Uncharacterized protein n=1 Tax=Nesidiocoris tenuis TaxID=355587 RepID=A0ABN7AYS6_9HEMI|nr:Hypothetical protein NTJ_10116 [Nesidiocoris tenuis]